MATGIETKTTEDTKAEQPLAKEQPEEKKVVPTVAESTEEKLAKQKEKRLKIKAEINALRQVLDDLRNNDTQVKVMMEEVVIKNRNIAELTERLLKCETKLRHFTASPRHFVEVPKNAIRESFKAPTNTSFTLTEAKWQRILQETTKELTLSFLPFLGMQLP